ncbi:uncharacterized protein LOC117588456 [Drosophila guanche]|uniref:uncharacterized protein LOC117588456 n=1 Tax=Drosophila guanche TaxID=7266 RepID=UPI001472512A|nr:uncharacterized protein LOC117588456 [Drosophila guanche]
MDEHVMSVYMTHRNSDRKNNSNQHENINIKEGFDHTESDATHPILRVDYSLQGQLVQCLTCCEKFEYNTFSDICSHYTYYHSQNQGGCAKCLYCLRDVHYYLRAGKVHPEAFHYCSPRKQN